MKTNKTSTFLRGYACGIAFTITDAESAADKGQKIANLLTEAEQLDHAIEEKDSEPRPPS
jgi:hypothetical protein